MSVQGEERRAVSILDEEIEVARRKAQLRDRQAPGSFGAGHGWGFLEGLLRARELLRGPALVMADGTAPGRGRAVQRTETT